MNETFITPGQPDDRQARIQALLSQMGHQPMSHEQAMVQMRQGGQPPQPNPRDRVGAQARVQAILRRLGDQNQPSPPQRPLNFQNPHWGNNAVAMQLMDEEQARRGGGGMWNEGRGGPPETDMDVMQAWESGMAPTNPGGVNYAMPWRDEGGLTSEMKRGLGHPSYQGGAARGPGLTGPMPDASIEALSSVARRIGGNMARSSGLGAAHQAWSNISNHLASQRQRPDALSQNSMQWQADPLISPYEEPQQPDWSSMMGSPLRQQLLRQGQGQQGPQQSLYDRRNELQQAMDY